MKARNGKSATVLAVALLGLALPGLASAATDQAAAQKLKSYVSSNGLSCMACHGIEDKKIGPSWIDVSKKLSGDPNEIATLTDRIHNGGSGTWGSVPMPPNMANKAQSAKLAKLIAKLYKK